MTLTRAFEKLRDAGVIVPLAPRPLPHPIPPHFRSHEHCLYHQIPGHDTERCSALHHAIQDLIDLGVVDLARPSVTTNPLPAHSTHAVPPPPVDMGTSFCSDLAQSTFHFDLWSSSESFPFCRVQCLAHQSRFVNIYTLFLLIRYVHPFIITFGVGTPRSGTHDVFTHCISCTRSMGIISLGYLSLPTLRPCLKTTPRPLLHIVFDSHVGNTRDWSEIIPWSMMDEDIVTSDGLYWGIAGWRAFSLEHSHPIWILSDWFFTLEHLPSYMVIIRLFHVVLIAYVA
ncbi:hypothetical protein AAG906_012463 [Vitis piasezkii]